MLKVPTYMFRHQGLSAALYGSAPVADYRQNTPTCEVNPDPLNIVLNENTFHIEAKQTAITPVADS